MGIQLWPIEHHGVTLMSLDFYLTDIKDYKTLCWIDDPLDNVLNPVTDRLVWGCMAIGIGIITEKTYEEWYIRYRVWCWIRHIEVGITLADVRAHIGLRTNVFPKETRNQFNKRHMDGIFRDEVRLVRNEKGQLGS
jgi:hypothetical protein